MSIVNRSPQSSVIALRRAYTTRFVAVPQRSPSRRRIQQIVHADPRRWIEKYRAALNYVNEHMSKEDEARRT